MEREREETLKRLLPQKGLNRSDAEKWVRIKYHRSLEELNLTQWTELHFALIKAKVHKNY